MVRFEVMAFEKPTVSPSRQTVGIDSNRQGFRADFPVAIVYQAPGPPKPGKTINQIIPILSHSSSADLKTNSLSAPHHINRSSPEPQLSMPDRIDL